MKRNFMETSMVFVVLVLLWPEISLVCEGQFSFPSKKATQSQTYGLSTADRAIDGNPNTCAFAAVGTGSPTFGWWQVDLGDIFTVSGVTLTSETNDGSQAEYLQNFAIFVGDTNNTDPVGDSNLCYYFNNGSFVPTGVPLTLDCTPNPLNGRYVTIRRRGGDRQDAIGLCEVNIKYYTVGYINILYLPTNQTGGYTDQYGVYHGSSLANDWNLQTCSQPVNPSGTPKWFVDLQNFYAVTAVTAFNQDSNANFNSVPRYLSYFYIRVGNSTDFSSQTQCCYYNDVVPVGGNVTCTCQSMIIGRYISFERTANGNENPSTLVICEVLVQGYKANGMTQTSSSTTKFSTLFPSTKDLTQPIELSSSTVMASTESSLTSGEITTQRTSSTDDRYSAATTAAVVLGILFGICLVTVVILAIYIVRLRRQNKPNIYEIKTANTEPPRDYEILRRTTHESPNDIGPTQLQSRTTESIESPYDEVTMAPL